MEEKRYTKYFFPEDAEEVKERAKKLGKSKAKKIAKKYIDLYNQTLPYDEALDEMKKKDRANSEELKKYREIEVKREKAFNKLQKTVDKKPRMRMSINARFENATHSYGDPY